MFYLTLISIVFLIFAGIFFCKSFVNVGKNEAAVIEKSGQYDRTLKEGVHFIVPFFEKTRWPGEPGNIGWSFLSGCKKIRTDEQVMSFPKDGRTFFSNDNKQYKVKCDITYKITDPKKAVYEVVYLLDALNQLVAGIVQKRLIDASDSENCIERIKRIFDNVLETSNEYASNWGVEITDISLKQIIEPNGIRHNTEG